MIYTITFNPALDYLLQVEKFENGKINRTKEEKILPGGKGVNVSIMLNNLGIKSTALGFIGGFTGEELKRLIENQGVETDFIKLKKGRTRINVKINSEEETALNANGPEISESEINGLIEKIQEIKKEDIVILSGNVPKGVNNNIYEIICVNLERNGVKYIVDSTKELLLNVLKYRPFLIKPNKEELEETFKVKIQTKEEFIEYAKKLQIMGAQNVLISLGGDGAILVTENQDVYILKPPKGKVINTVGAGDSMVAGFVAGYEKTRDYEYAFKMGLATGSASAFSKELATKEEVEMLLKQL